MPLFDDPEETTGLRINPADIMEHLLLVWSIEYIEHSPTRFSTPEKKSDVIVVDLVDLDLDDPGTNEVGLVGRRQWWRQGKLIQTLRDRVGRERPMLATMTKGVGTQGFAAPYVLAVASGDPAAVERANQWMKAHPDFTPSLPRDAWAQQQAKSQGPQPEWSVPQPQQTQQPQQAQQARPLAATQAKQSSLMDQLKAMADQNRAKNLPQPPQSDQPGY